VWITRLAGLTFALFCGAAVVTASNAGCSGWDPTKPFERNSPEVEEALKKLDAGEFESAEEVLGRYLGTGVCGDGGLGIPDKAREKYNGSFDLGLVLFHIAEKFGRRFGEEELEDAGADDPQAAKRSTEIDCALLIVKAIAADPKVPVELRARARYLAGNLEFLRKHYEEAVKEYDDALGLVPGIPEDAGGDGIGRDAAWNRAIALRRIQDQKDAGNDADADSDAPDSDDGEADAPDAPDGEDAADGNDGDADSGDSGNDASNGDAGNQPPDAGQDGGQDGGDGGATDAGKDGGDAGKDDSKQDEPQPTPTEGPKEPAAPDSRQDDRILDRLEEAPSYQEEEAKKRAAGRRRGRMEDK
jgi:hypothetical protein